jgi:diguanylate cyclase (GGDEF)-like protein
MDPFTAFVIAILMMLLNGGVLGLMHSELPEELRPSAYRWRLGTLLFAGGSMLLAVQMALPPAFILPVASGLVMLGLTCYVSALRRYFNVPEGRLIWLPAILGALSLLWFTTVSPSIVARVICATLVWLGLLMASVVTLARHQRDSATSSRVMSTMLILIAAFMLGRAFWFVSSIDPASTVLDSRHLINLVTPIVAAILPVIGTTIFLLMCSQRIRQFWENAASTDYLTGLPNRRTLFTQGETLLAQQPAESAGVAVGVIDIDCFKAINDRHGHDAGDQALAFVANRILATCRKTDLLARQGGEEFAIILSDVDPGLAEAAMEAIRNAVASEAFRYRGASIPMTVSLGFAMLSASERTLDDGLRRADVALYRSKSEGRNRTTQADSDLVVQVSTR